MCIPVIGAVLEFVLLFVKSIEQSGFALALVDNRGGSASSCGSSGAVVAPVVPSKASSSSLLDTWAAEFFESKSETELDTLSLSVVPVPCSGGRKGRKRKVVDAALVSANQANSRESADTLTRSVTASHLLDMFADELGN